MNANDQWGVIRRWSPAASGAFNRRTSGPPSARASRYSFSPVCQLSTTVTSGNPPDPEAFAWQPVQFRHGHALAVRCQPEVCPGAWSAQGPAGRARSTSLLGALALALDPVYFALSFSFMTEVPFVSFSALAASHKGVWCTTVEAWPAMRGPRLGFGCRRLNDPG